MDNPNLISRSAAISKLSDLWEKQREKLDANFVRYFHEYEWPKLRNYELEEELNRHFEKDWVVSERCPFNGVFCEATSYVPLSALRNWIAEAKRNKENYILNYLNKELEKRSKS